MPGTNNHEGLMAKYLGKRTLEGQMVRVEEDGRKYPLPFRHDIRHHSAEFEWGDMGSGSSQLALAILAHYTRDCDEAQHLSQQFKTEVIAGISDNEWEITQEQMDTWLSKFASNDAGTPDGKNPVRCNGVGIPPI